jgi:hypothetical protein
MPLASHRCLTLWHQCKTESHWTCKMLEVPAYEQTCTSCKNNILPESILYTTAAKHRPRFQIKIRQVPTSQAWLSVVKYIQYVERVICSTLRQYCTILHVLGLWVQTPMPFRERVFVILCVTTFFWIQNLQCNYANQNIIRLTLPTSPNRGVLPGWSSAVQTSVQSIRSYVRRDREREREEWNIKAEFIL